LCDEIRRHGARIFRIGDFNLNARAGWVFDHQQRWLLTVPEQSTPALIGAKKLVSVFAQPLSLWHGCSSFVIVEPLTTWSAFLQPTSSLDPHSASAAHLHLGLTLRRWRCGNPR
jgi:hypothetical protein